MTPSARSRQNRYRQRKKDNGFHRLEVWVPDDVMAEIARRYCNRNGSYWPQPAIIDLLRKTLDLPKPRKTALDFLRSTESRI